MKRAGSAWVVVFVCLGLSALAPAGESAGQVCGVFPADNIWIFTTIYKPILRLLSMTGSCLFRISQ
jgi:hypothetical protein